MQFNNPALAAVAETIGADPRNASRATNYPYLIPFNFATIAPGGSSTITQKISAAGAFVIYATTGVVHDGTNAVTSPLIDVGFSVNDGVWQLGDNSWQAVVGTAVQPFFWLFRPVAAPGSQLNVTITNRTAGTTISGRVTLCGYVLGL